MTSASCPSAEVRTKVDNSPSEEHAENLWADGHCFHALIAQTTVNRMMVLRCSLSPILCTLLLVTLLILVGKVNGSLRTTSQPSSLVAPRPQTTSTATALNHSALVLASSSSLSSSALAKDVTEEATAASSSTSLIDNRPLKILVMVEPSPLTYVCGYANRFQALFRHLATTNDHVQVVTTEVVVPDKPDTWLGFPVHHTRGFRLPSYPHLSLCMDWTLKAPRVMRRMRPDLIHVSSPGCMVMAAVLYARVFSIPIVSSYHTHLPVYVRSYLPKFAYLTTIFEFLTWRLIQIFHSLVDLTVVTSPQIQAEFVAHGIRDCEVWQKGIDTDRFHPRFQSLDMRQRMTNGHPQDFLIAYVGRLGKEKRLKELRAILERMPQTRLCIVGTGPYEAELREHFRDNDNAVFLGQLSGDELSAAFSSADVFCMPSDSETLGFVVLESMASGVPVVGAKAGGIPHIIHDEETGFLVEAGNIDAFVVRLLTLQKDSKLRTSMGQKGRDEMQKWNWEASMHRLRTEQYKLALENFEHRLEKRIWRFFTFQKC